MARPRKELDFEVFEKLCSIGCTEAEIAHWFDMTRDTLETRIKEHYGESFSTVHNKYFDEGKMSLRRVQYTKAMEGNVAMMIWLGKQLLGQRDKQDIEQVSQVTMESDVNINLNGEFTDFAKRVSERLGYSLS